MNVPASIDAERRVLGTLLVFHSPEAVAAVKATKLQPADFWWQGHEAVYRAILALDARDGYADTLTVSRFLAGHRHSKAGNWLHLVGGDAKLEELCAHSDANGLVPCARIVVEESRWRRLFAAWYGGGEALEARDLDGFWEVVALVQAERPAKVPAPLRVIPSESEAA